MIKTVTCSKHLMRPLRPYWLRREKLLNNESVFVQYGSCYRTSSGNKGRTAVSRDGKHKKIFSQSNLKSKQTIPVTNEESKDSERNTFVNFNEKSEEEAFVKQIKMVNPQKPKDIVNEMYYGSIKFDVNQNTRTKHKSHEQNVNKDIPSMKESNFFEENYFSDHCSTASQNSTYTDSNHSVDKNLNEKRYGASSQENYEDLNFFDETLLYEYSIANKSPHKSASNIENEDINRKNSTGMQNTSKSKEKHKDDLNFFDETLLSEYHSAENDLFVPATNLKLDDLNKSAPKEGHKQGPKMDAFSRKSKKYIDPVTESEEYSIPHNVSEKKQLPNKSRVNSDDALQENELDNFNYFDEILFGSIQSDKAKTGATKERIGNTEEVNRTEAVESAYDYVMAMRKGEKQSSKISNQNSGDLSQRSWKGKLDSQGFRILTEQVRDLQRLPQSTVINILKKSVIYEDEQLIAINKPYGIASHGGPGIHNSIGKLLQPLAQSIDRSLNQLYMVHRLDKEATGVMLLSKNAACAKKLVEMFKRREVVKKYWTITKGVPNPQEGVIDIPICEATVEGKVRMALKPYYPEEMRKDLHLPQHKGVSGAQEAITNFKVLDHHGNAALVLCQPESGIKHQIRCHLAFGLNTPILGDHKYSHLSKVAPQKLPSDMLQRLGIRQSKVRHVPMHLHAATVILPEFNNGNNLFINARLPKHFLQNMKWLKLKLRT